MSVRQYWGARCGAWNVASVQHGDLFCSGQRLDARPKLLQVRKADSTNEEKRKEQKAKERKEQGKEEKRGEEKKNMPGSKERGSQGTGRKRTRQRQQR